MPLRTRIVKEMKIIAISLALGLTLTVIIAAGSYVYSEAAQSEIARSVIRFHVLANSDSEEDQALKIKVRDAVLDNFRAELNASNSVQQTKVYLSAHLKDIEAAAAEVIRANGYDYPVKATISHDYFPTKVYGDVVFPPGDYEALRIVIGKGEGKNWWCVMFPPLCLVDATRGETVITEEQFENDKKQLMRYLPEEEYKLLTHQSQDESVKIKFKIVEWWQNLKQPKDEEKISTQTAMK